MSLWTPPWHHGLTWKTELIEVTEPFLAVSVQFVCDKVLRSVTEGAEDDLIELYIRAATQLAENYLLESIRPQTRRLIASGFPTVAPGSFELHYPPVRDVLSVEYYDGDGLQTYGGSPPTWVLTGGQFVPATIAPGPDEVWPTSSTRADAVAITYRTGYATPQEVPHLTKVGIAFVVGEMYRNPSLANVEGQVANQLNLAHFFPRRYV